MTLLSLGAHQNMLENVPLLWSSTLVAGLKYPVVAASLCALYLLTRIPYTLGYRTGVPEEVCSCIQHAA